MSNIPVQRKVQSKKNSATPSEIYPFIGKVNQGRKFMATQYRIGKFAELSGVSAKTLRFYDEIGLLRPVGVDPRTHYRFYVPQQLKELAFVVALKNIGMPLADIRSLSKKSGSSTAGSKEERRAILNDLKKTIEHSVQMAAQSLSWINAALDELDDSRRPIPVVVKRRPPVQVASIRSTVQSYAEIERFERELLNALPPESIGDLRGVLWHRCADSGSLEGEPFVALKQPAPRRSVYDVKHLPSATLACA